MENKSIQILSFRKNNRSWEYIDLEQEDTIDVFHRFGELKIKSNNVEYIQDKSRQFIQNFPFPHIILTINKLSYLFNSSLVLQAHYNLRFLFYFSTKDTLTVPRSSFPLENHNRDMKKQPQVGGWHRRFDDALRAGCAPSPPLPLPPWNFVPGARQSRPVNYTSQTL